MVRDKFYDLFVSKGHTVQRILKKILRMNGFLKLISVIICILLKSYQGNQNSRGNQKNVIQGRRPDMDVRKTQQRTQNN